MLSHFKYFILLFFYFSLYFELTRIFIPAKLSLSGMLLFVFYQISSLTFCKLILMLDVKKKRRKEEKKGVFEAELTFPQLFFLPA